MEEFKVANNFEKNMYYGEQNNIPKHFFYNMSQLRNRTVFMFIKLKSFFHSTFTKRI